jgi:hypothetical protein
MFCVLVDALLIEPFFMILSVLLELKLCTQTVASTSVGALTTTWLKILQRGLYIYYHQKPPWSFLSKCCINYVVWYMPLWNYYGCSPRCLSWICIYHLWWCMGAVFSLAVFHYLLYEGSSKWLLTVFYFVKCRKIFPCYFAGKYACCYYILYLLLHF